MIKTEKGFVEVNGSVGELSADLGVIVLSLYNNVLLDEMSEEEAKEFILDVVNDAMVTKEEAKKEFKTELVDFLEGLVNFLKGQGDE